MFSPLLSGALYVKLKSLMSSFFVHFLFYFVLTFSLSFQITSLAAIVCFPPVWLSSPPWLFPPVSPYLASIYIPHFPLSCASSSCPTCHWTSIYLVTSLSQSSVRSSSLFCLFQFCPSQILFAFLSDFSSKWVIFRLYFNIFCQFFPPSEWFSLVLWYLIKDSFRCTLFVESLHLGSILGL